MEIDENPLWRGVKTVSVSRLAPPLTIALDIWKNRCKNKTVSWTYSTGEFKYSHLGHIFQGSVILVSEGCVGGKAVASISELS